MLAQCNQASQYEPMFAGATIQGWLTSRSRVQLYHNHVRWCWQVAGIWKGGRVEEARARCGLLIAAADQASIDRGNWVVGNVSLLEAPPPYHQAFSQHHSRASGSSARCHLRPQMGGDFSGPSEGGGCVCGCQEETWKWKGSCQGCHGQQQLPAKGEAKAQS